MSEALFVFRASRNGFMLQGPAHKALGRISNTEDVRLIDGLNLLPDDALQIRVEQIGIRKICPAQIGIYQIGVFETLA